MRPSSLSGTEQKNKTENVKFEFSRAKYQDFLEFEIHLKFILEVIMNYEFEFSRAEFTFRYVPILQ